MSAPLFFPDTFGRHATYLRLAVTDRCNLRCQYCMPENANHFRPKHDLLSYEEMLRLVGLLAQHGVSKVRITGGEPFVRQGLDEFLAQLVRLKGVEQVSITSNGTLARPFIPKLKELGITSINLSLDAYNKIGFEQSTRRDMFDEVQQTLFELLDKGFEVKINSVATAQRTAEDIVALASLAKTYPVEVRFIEEMPFNGSGKSQAQPAWRYEKIVDLLQNSFEGLHPIESSASNTAMRFHAHGFLGNLGVIAAFSRTFCGTCNRIRITPTGILQTCLYSQRGLDLRSMLRGSSSDLEIVEAVRASIMGKKKDGFEAEKEIKNQPAQFSSMSAIGG